GERREHSWLLRRVRAEDPRGCPHERLQRLHLVSADDGARQLVEREVVSDGGGLGKSHLGELGEERLFQVRPAGWIAAERRQALSERRARAREIPFGSETAGEYERFRRGRGELGGRDKMVEAPILAGVEGIREGAVPGRVGPIAVIE